jgi:hypothetical protein
MTDSISLQAKTKDNEFYEWFLLLEKAIEYGISKEEVRLFFQEYSKGEINK